MLKNNKDKLVKLSVQGKIHHPYTARYRISHEGKPMILPATGGIAYNVKIGDSAFGWVADHLEPGVSIRNEEKAENEALITFACIGNEAKVVTGDAKGVKGYVTGTHGGIDHVIIHFEEEVLENMAIDDKILVKGYGQGFSLEDYPSVIVQNIDPDLFLKLDIKEEDGVLLVPVAAKIPAHLMGSGIGSTSSYSGDYDIMTADKEAVNKHGIDKLKFGDLVLLENCDNTFGRGYLKGAVSIGIVIHSDCILMGHGPGITTIMTSKEPLIKGYISQKANISSCLKAK